MPRQYNVADQNVITEVLHGPMVHGFNITLPNVHMSAYVGGPILTMIVTSIIKLLCTIVHTMR